jgi:hypothetical protein
MPTTRKANSNNKHTGNRMYGRCYVVLWINRWIGHVTRTKHRDTRLEYRASESKNVKWVERKGLAWKDCRRTFEELVVAHITMKRPIWEEVNRYNKQQMQHLLLRIKNRHDHVKHACMTWQLWCNATYPIKRNWTPDTHIYGSSCFTTRQFKCWLAWQRQGIGELHKIKWSGENHI